MAPAGTEASVESLVLRVGSFDFEDMKHGYTTVVVPLDATVDNLIASTPTSAGCAGFLVAHKPQQDDRFDGYGYDDDEDTPSPTGLADRLTADGGTLLQAGRSLLSYGIESASCAELLLFAVFTELDKQPTVFKRDIEELGFGENVYGYIQLREEDKELVEARQEFQAPLFPWLQNGSENEICGTELAQSIAFSMEDNFEEVPKPVLTVHIVHSGGELEASCTNLAGDRVCAIKLLGDDSVANLQSSLCKALEWASMALWDDSEKVPETSHVSKYSLLTAERTGTIERISGCYQRYEFGVGPAGYSASGSSFANVLVLEPGRAALKYHFKGDYKRAEELRKLVMADARWSVDPSLGEGKHVVRIIGKAKLDRYWVHERCGYEGPKIDSYECYALVTIPVQQLEQGQTEERHSQSTAGGGWTCGSEKYRCSFFLPVCLLNALREQDGDNDELVLRKHLHIHGQQDYPYNLMSSARRMFGESVVVKVSQEAFDMIKHFRDRLQGKVAVTMDEIRQVQASALKHNSATYDDE